MTDANVRYVVAGSVLLGGIAGTFGCFAFLQKRSLIGDAIAHATLPGVAFAFLILGEKKLHWLRLHSSGFVSLADISAMLHKASYYIRQNHSYTPYIYIVYVCSVYIVHNPRLVLGAQSHVGFHLSDIRRPPNTGGGHHNTVGGDHNTAYPHRNRTQHINP